MLDRLKQYKEFIAILIFFIGGFLWIYGFFATKVQLEAIHCLNNLSVTMVESRMRTKFLLDDLERKGLEYSRLSQMANRSSQQDESMVRVENEIEMLRDGLKSAQQTYDQSYKRMKENACNQP